MKATGIVRRIDNLGRIVIPKEVRKRFDLEEMDPVEVFTEDQTIVLRKYSPACDYITQLERIRNNIRADDDLRIDKARTAAALLERAIAELEESE